MTEGLVAADGIDREAEPQTHDQGTGDDPHGGGEPLR
jgi:hypothetical protein